MGGRHRQQPGPPALLPALGPPTVRRPPTPAWAKQAYLTAPWPTWASLGAGSLNSPTALAIDSFSNLAVADSGNNRVLRFASPGNGSVANTSWGQSGSFSSNGVNAPGLGNQSLGGPRKGSLLFWPISCSAADSGNNRVLQFDLSPPLTQSASVLLGQATYGANSINRGFGITADDRLNNPQALGLDLSGRVLVADSGNNRIIGFEPPFGDHGAQVWGQPNLSSGSSGLSSDNLNNPTGAAASGSTLIVADTGNQRVLLYGCGAAVQANTPTSTFTPTSTVTPTSTQTPTFSVTPSITATFSISPSFSPSPSFTISTTPSVSPTITPTLRASR